MNFEEILKNSGASNEAITKIKEGMKTNKIYTTSLENIDERYNKLKAQKDELKKELETSSKTIEDLKNSTNDIEKLNSTIKEYEAKVKQFEIEKSEMALNNALDVELQKHNVKDINIFKKTLDKSLIKYVDGKITGLDGQVEDYKKNAPFLFNVANTGKVDGDDNNKVPSIGEQLAKIKTTDNLNTDNLDKFFK